MRTPLDILRSVQRYLAVVLPEPWDIRIGIENETPERPYVLVTRNGPSLPVGAYGAHTQRLQQPITVHAYLAEADSREVAEVEAAAMEGLLFHLFKTTGAAPATRGDVVPLWDFIGDTTGGTNPPRAHCDYASIKRYAARSLADPNNPRRMTTIVDLALEWFLAGSTAPSGTIPVSSIRVTGASPPRTNV